jgi:hypothetical protein
VHSRRKNTKSTHTRILSFNPPIFLHFTRSFGFCSLHGIKFSFAHSAICLCICIPIPFLIQVFLHFSLTYPSFKQMHPKMFDYTTITRNLSSIVSRIHPYTLRRSIPIPIPIFIRLSILNTTLSLPPAIPLYNILRLTLILQPS